MKIKEDFLLKTVAGRNIVVPVGAASLDFNAMITLNDTGAFLWKRLESGASEDELVSALLDEYDVDAARASDSVARFIGELEKADLLQEAGK